MSIVHPTPSALARLADEITRRNSMIGLRGNIHYDTINEPIPTLPPEWLVVGAVIEQGSRGPQCTVEAVSDTLCIIRGEQVSWAVDTSILARCWQVKPY